MRFEPKFISKKQQAKIFGFIVTVIFKIKRHFMIAK